MTNDELKKKISQIIAEYCCPLGKTHKQLYGDERQCYSEMNFAECKPITECTDALIAAGIGDLKEHRIFAGKDGSIKQLYSGEEVEKIVKERKELKDELRSKVEYIHEQDEVVKEYKHRAEVAERALREACSRAWSIECTCPSIFEDNDECSECYKNQSEKRYEEKDAIDCLSKKLLEQAEKELAEENSGKKKI